MLPLRLDSGYGPLLENFKVSEVLKLITWSGKRVRVSHFRTKEKDEVDLVLHDHDRITPFDQKLQAAPVQCFGRGSAGAW